jgi:outer membrane protein assembly factor BamB
MAGQMMQAVAARVVLVALLLLSGCWLQVGGGPGHTRFNWIESGLTRENVDTLHMVWSESIQGNQSEAIVSGGRVFITSTPSQEEARVRAFDAATGATVWDQLLVGRPSGAELVSVAGAPVAFVGEELWTGHSLDAYWWDGREECAFTSDVLDPATGERLRGTSGFPSAAVSSGAIVTRTLRGADSTGCTPSGGPVLEVSRREPDGSFTTWRSTTAVGTLSNEGPTLTGDKVVVLGDATTIHAFAVDGCGALTCAPTWTASLDAPVSVLAVPVADATGPIFVLSGNNLVALDRGTGVELWRAPLSGLGADLALANGTVYATSIDWGEPEPQQRSQLQAFEADGCGVAACEPLWAASLGDQTGTSPTVGGGVVYVVGGGYVRAFDADGCGAATCSSLVSVFVLSGGSLSLAQGRLFVAGSGRLTALEPDASG